MKSGAPAMGAPWTLYRTLAGEDTWQEQLLVPEPIEPLSSEQLPDSTI